MKHISLLYHDVVSGDPGSSGFSGADADIYKLSESHFRAHLARISEIGEGRVQLANLSWPIRTSKIPVLLTFDDGGSSAYEPTASLLEARGWRGHFFIVTSRIGQPGFITSEQIRDLHRRGHHIGSHSHSHPKVFSELGDEEMLREWSVSRQILTEILDQPPWSSSVPGGFYSRRVALAAIRCGYQAMFNSEPTAKVVVSEGLLILGRYSMQRHTSDRHARALGRADFLPRAIQTLFWNAKKPLKRFGGKAWFRFRRWFFENPRN